MVVDTSMPPVLKVISVLKKRLSILLVNCRTIRRNYQMFKSILYFITLLLFAWGCKTPEARRPVKTTSGSYINNSVERNKKMIAEEEKDIMKLIEKDTVNEIINSEYGFWYYYNIKKPTEEEKADFGDIIEFEYDVKDLNGKLIYSKEELGKQYYQM